MHVPKAHRHFSAPHIHGVVSEKRKTRHEDDARTRDLAQRTPVAGEAAADRGADGGDEVAAAGGGVNAGAHAAGHPAIPRPPAVRRRRKGAKPRAMSPPHQLHRPMTYIRPMGGPLAPLAGKALRDRAPQRCGEIRRELAFSGRPTNPPPPSGESGSRGRCFPRTSSTANDIPTANDRRAGRAGGAGPHGREWSGYYGVMHDALAGAAGRGTKGGWWLRRAGQAGGVGPRRRMRSG